ncbi:MAG: fasciclin domain-containing protein [Planctomycetota bacterium]
MKSLKLGAALFVASLCVAPQANSADIVDTAVGAKQFKTLVAAVGAADLVDALKGDGPFTVLAPTDEAFAKLPEGTIETLLKPENKAKLTAILTYHVLPKQVPASTVVTLNDAKTLGGQAIQIRADSSGVRINDANVIQTDIACDNGLIHVIDSVLLPPEKAAAKAAPATAGDIVDTAVAAGKFKTLAAALGAADLVDALKGDGPFTVLAPTDEAFAKLPPGTIATLLRPENKAKLTAILTYHVIPGRVPASEVVKLNKAKTLGGQTVRIRVVDGRVRINDATVTATDVMCDNGIIHIIDSVLLPPEPSTASTSARACSSLAAAIEKGAPLYNAGHHGACVNVYRTTLNDLMHTGLDSAMQSHIRTVLRHADQNHNMSDRAWTLRRGMDQMYVTLRNRD